MIDSTRNFFDTLATILLRCWLFGLGLLLVSFIVILCGADLIDDIHRRMFGLASHELRVIFYCWLGALKVLVLVLFFVPWLAIRSVLRQQKT